MNSINLTRNGGLPFSQNTLNYMQNSYTELFAAIGDCIGNKTIVAGMAVGGSSVAEGWFVYNGEFIKFNACTLDTKISISETLESVEFEDGLTKAVYYTKTAICAGVGDFDFSELQRAAPFNEQLKTKYDNTWVSGDIKMVTCDNAYIATNFDATGLGRLERLGWAICNGQNGTAPMNGRVPVGFDANTIDPANNVWDVAYNTMGTLLGKLKHILGINEIPVHDHVMHGKGVLEDINYAYLTKHSDRYTGGNSGNPTFGSRSTVDNELRTGDTGGGEGFKIVQPSIVTLFIQKI